jgi:hypothetical protein
MRQVLLVLSLFALISSVTLAADNRPPQIRSCESEFTEEQINDRIDCKTENANAAMFDYVDTVIELDKTFRYYGRAPIFTDSQMDHLMSARERAQSGKNRSHDAKVFRGIARKQKSQDADCYVKEIIGDGKGNDIQPCEKNEDCEELSGDGIGNDDGVCVIKGNPNLREVCVEVCQQPLVDDDDNYDMGSSADTEQRLGELEVVLMDATDEVKGVIGRVHQLHSTRPNASTDECDMFEFGLFPGSIALQATQVVKNVADAAFNTCSVACNQDAFGWNCEAACVVFAIVSGIANSVNDGFSVRDGANGSDQLDRVAKCTRQLNTEIASLQTAVQGTQGAIDEVNMKVDALSVQIEELMKFMEARFLTVEDHLCTPQGQRECFPGGAVRTTGELLGTSRTREVPTNRRDR